MAAGCDRVWSDAALVPGSGDEHAAQAVRRPYCADSLSDRAGVRGLDPVSAGHRPGHRRHPRGLVARPLRAGHSRHRRHGDRHTPAGRGQPGLRPNLRDARRGAGRPPIRERHVDQDGAPRDAPGDRRVSRELPARADNQRPSARRRDSHPVDSEPADLRRLRRRDRRDGGGLRAHRAADHALQPRLQRPVRSGRSTRSKAAMRRESAATSAT